MVDCATVPTYIWYMPYSVYFTDEAEYNFYVGILGGTSLTMNPEDASVLFGAPLLLSVPLNPDGSTGWANPPGKGILPSPYGYNPDVGNPGQVIILGQGFDSVHVPCFGGGIGTWPNRDVYWGGHLVFIPDPIPFETDPSIIAPVPKRRWITGFEYNPTAEGIGNGGLELCRDASRTIEGVGATIRRSTNKNWERAVNSYRAGFTTRSSWERFYMRVRNFDPTNRIDIWKSVSSPSALSGIRLYINTDGTVNVYNVTSAGTETLLVTTGVIFTLDVFQKIDILITYNELASGGSGRFRLYVGGVLQTDQTVVAASGGLGQISSFHTSSRIGTQSLAAANVWEIDIDDWINSDIPTIDGLGVTEALTSIDWSNGCHVAPVRVDAASMTGWTGVSELFNGMMSPLNVSAGGRMTSITPSAQLRGLTNLSADYLQFVNVVIAHLSSIISKFGQRAGSADGLLGYNLAGTGDALATIVESGAVQHNTVAYLGTGTDIIPHIMFPYEIIHEKAASTDLATVYAVAAVVEMCGLWPDDVVVGPGTAVTRFFLHNGAFWNNAPWNGPFMGNGSTCIFSGLYVGNGTQQVITVGDIPFHFLFVRPLTGGSANGFRWFSTGLAGHFGAALGSAPECPHSVFWDEATFTANFAVAGTNVDVNANGVVYQYIAFADPTCRYMCNGAYLQPTATASRVHELFSQTFTPDAVWTQFESISAQSNAVRMAYKGVGHPTDTGNRTDGTALADYMTFGLGTLTAGPDANAGLQTTYSAWRSSYPGSSAVMVQLTSYVGDGTASRNIPLTPAANRWPLLAIVVPHSGGETHFKDPSHAATQCGLLNSASNTVNNAIIGGGIDILTVGATLNGLGVVYDVFVLPGADNGWFQLEMCSNDEPPIFIPPIDNPLPDIAVLPEGGLILGGTTPLTILRDASGIYTLQEGKTNDTLYDRQTGIVSVDVAIPDPNAKTGYIGG